MSRGEGSPGERGVVMERALRSSWNDWWVSALSRKVSRKPEATEGVRQPRQSCRVATS